MTTATTDTDESDQGGGGGGERAEGCGQAAGAHHEGACGPDGRECGIPVADCERSAGRGLPRCGRRSSAVLGEVPGQGTVYRQGGVVNGESSFIRERARTLGMTMKDLSDRVGVSYSYMTQVARGRQNMGVKVQVQGRVGAECPGEDRVGAVRQPPGGAS